MGATVPTEREMIVDRGFQRLHLFKAPCGCSFSERVNECPEHGEFFSPYAEFNRAKLRASALAKLTPEEREALGV